MHFLFLFVFIYAFLFRRKILCVRQFQNILTENKPFYEIIELKIGKKSFTKPTNVETMSTEHVLFAQLIRDSLVCVCTIF